MKVSVAMVTYNHEKFLAQAIDSVLMQKVNFDYEIVIGEDCSPDNTREIVLDYSRQYPDKIRMLLREKNLGMRNWTQTLKLCQGQYVAILEGDDYWTSPHKLQKQVDFLDGHPECAICFHSVWKVYEDGLQESQVFSPPGKKSIYRLEDLMRGNFMGTCSVMFRNGLFDDFPEWYYKLPIGDWPLHVLNAQYGDIGFIDETLGVYRLHSGGIMSRRLPLQRMQFYIDTREQINAFLDYRYNKIVREAISEEWERLAIEIAGNGLLQGSIDKARDKVNKWLDQGPESITVTDDWKSKVWGTLYLNFAYAAHNNGNLRAARDYLLQALRFCPHFVLNLGVWSVGLEVLMGQRATGWMRNLFRKARGWLIETRVYQIDGQR